MATVLSTIAGSETNVSDEALEELRAVIRGNVLTPGDEGMRGYGPRTTPCRSTDRG